MKPSGAAVDVLLWISQSQLAPHDDETFVERAARINAPEGLGQIGNLIEVWDPATESLAIHRARILRGDKVIDLLADGRKFTVLRRETNLEAAMIDGELTATLQPEGLQVGDIVDLAATVTRREPALADHSESGVASGHTGTIGRLVVSVAWPTSRVFRSWKTDDLPDLTSTTHKGWTEIGFDQTGAVSPDPPTGASAYDRMFGLLLASDFATWNEVSATAYPLYAKAAALPPNSTLQAEIARIRAASPDPKSRALAALELVEGQIRYLYVGLDDGGFTPASADVTWARRFGDCKGKTVLLLALLQGLGIKAEPALVNTAVGEGLDRQLPQMSAFDHVVARTEIDGAVYWLDGTRLGDENLDVLPVPNFHWALPVRAEGAGLEPLAPKRPPLPLGETLEQVDAHDGIDKPARVHEELILRGDAALVFSLTLKQASRIDADRTLKETLTAGRGWIKPDKVGFTYDAQKMEARAVLDGGGVLPLVSANGSSGGVRDWLVDDAAIGANADLTRRSDYHRGAPFAVAYPAYARAIVEVKLPDGGKNFELYNGDNIDRTVASVAYSRTAAITNGRLTMVASTRSVGSSFPAADAASAESGLRGLANYDVSLRYTPPAAPGPLAAGKPSPPSTQNLDEAAKEASAASMAGDYAKAEAGYTAALAAQPSAKLYYNRAVARAAMGKEALALADLHTALKLDPKDAYAAFALGRFALRRGDAAEAAVRFADAEKDAVASTMMAEMIASAYEGAARYAESFPYWDRVAASETEPVKRARALNSSCWTRAEAGQDLGRALEDCNAALALAPESASMLDSRGLVELRLGAAAKAVADYSAALTKRPSTPTSLYGRALAEAKLGQNDQASADFAAARAVDAGVDKKFAGWGLSR